MVRQDAADRAGLRVHEKQGSKQNTATGECHSRLDVSSVIDEEMYASYDWVLVHERMMPSH
jgi:hypothetical protein